MKKLILILLACLLAIALSGCVDSEQATNVSANQAMPTPENNVESVKIKVDNTEALDFADQSIDPLEGDKFLDYIGDAGQRDKDERDDEKKEKEVVSLASEVNALESKSSSTSTSNNQTSNNQSTSPGQTPTPSPTPSPTPNPTPTPTEPKKPELVKYTNSDNGFSINFPSGWDRSETNENDVVVVAATSNVNDSLREISKVSVVDMPFEISVSEYLSTVLDDLEDLSGFQKLEESDTLVDGKSAVKLIYTYTSGEQTLKAVTYVVVNDFRGYTISSTSKESEFSGWQSYFGEIAAGFGFE